MRPSPLMGKGGVGGSFQEGELEYTFSLRGPDCSVSPDKNCVLKWEVSSVITRESEKLLGDCVVWKKKKKVEMDLFFTCRHLAFDLSFIEGKIVKQGADDTSSSLPDNWLTVRCMRRKDGRWWPCFTLKCRSKQCQLRVWTKYNRSFTFSVTSVSGLVSHLIESGAKQSTLNSIYERSFSLSTLQKNCNE